MNLGVSYVPTHLPFHIEVDMKNIRDIGCNEVLYAITENNLNAVNGSLRYGANIAQNYGLKPHAMICGYANTFGGYRISKVMLNNLDMWVEDENGNKRANACYNNPKTAGYFLEYSEKLIEYGYKAIFIDEPTKQECWCKYCREKYHNTYNADLDHKKNIVEVFDFKRNNAKQYIQAICDGIKRNHADIGTIVCVMPFDKEYWSEIVTIKTLDDFGTDPYWLVTNIGFERAVKDSQDVKKLCQDNHKLSNIWLNGWKIKAGDEEEVYTGGLKLAEAGCDSFYTWTYMAALGTEEECDDPYKTWSYVSKLYRELSGK